MSGSLKIDNPPIKIGYRRDIDGLRAFAIITVIINHFNKDLLPGGYLGVDIFFVISGFVITSSLSDRTSKNFKDFICGFYERRLKRLIPALSAFVLLVSIFVCLFNPSPGVAIRTGLTSLFGISNLYLLKQSTDYFSQSTQLNVFTQTWSLGVEEQFYILYPFLVWCSGFGRQTKNGERNLFLSVTFLTIVSLIAFIYLYINNQTAAYFLMPTRFWEIASGCLLFCGFKKNLFIYEYFKHIPSSLLLILIIGIMYLPSGLAIGSTIAVVTLSCVLIGSLSNQKAVYKILTNDRVTYIGLISYSLYLWHWAILSLSRWTIGIHLWSFPFQLLIIFALSIASYQYIEQPLRNGTWFKYRWKNILFSIKILIFVSISLLAIGGPLKVKIYTGNPYNEWNLKGFGETKIINNNSRPTIYLLGDSHAGHYGVVMKYLSEKEDFNLIMHPQGEGLEIKKDNGIKELILSPLRKYKNDFKKGDFVILSSSIGNFRGNEEFINAFKTFIQSTKKVGMKYYLISPTPVFTEFKKGDTCQEEWYRPKWAISPRCFTQINKNEWIEFNNVSISSINKFLFSNSEVSYIDTFSILCPDKNCKNFDNNSLIYKDAHHLTSYGAMKTRRLIETNLLSNKYDFGY